MASITEEDVTRSLLGVLEDAGWFIICFDFPQSGTGVALHPNNATSKTKDIWVPDIVAHKAETVVIFENKDHYDSSDVAKVSRLRGMDNYSNDLARLLSGRTYKKIVYGIGIPNSDRNRTKTLASLDKMDFAILLNEDLSVQNLGYDLHLNEKI